MNTPTVIELGALTLTRVLYVDVSVEPDVVGLTAPDLAVANGWNDHRWTEEERVRVGAAAWVASVDDQHVVIDPYGNADDIFHDPVHTAAHQEAIAAAFDAANIPLGAVTRVVVSHIEGIGMNAVREGDGWRPFFPRAQMSVGAAALADLAPAHPADGSIDSTAAVWRELIERGLVDSFDDGETIVAGMVAQHTGAHNPGHYAFHFGGSGTGDPLATAVGHLAISPLHLATGPCVPQHPDPELAWTLLHSFADDGRILLAPLWPSPGAGRWTGDQFVAIDEAFQSGASRSK